MTALDLSEIFRAAAGAPKTQQDIASIAEASRAAQSPQFQQELKMGVEKVESYAYAQLTLQAISTAALVVVAAIAVHKYVKNGS